MQKAEDVYVVALISDTQLSKYMPKSSQKYSYISTFVGILIAGYERLLQLNEIGQQQFVLEEAHLQSPSSLNLW